MTLAEAVAAAQPWDTIFVTTPYSQETVLVDKPLRIRGAVAAPGCHDARAALFTLRPPVLLAQARCLLERLEFSSAEQLDSASVVAFGPDCAYIRCDDCRFMGAGAGLMLPSRALPLARLELNRCQVSGVKMDVYGDHTLHGCAVAACAGLLVMRDCEVTCSATGIEVTEDARADIRGTRVSYNEYGLALYGQVHMEGCTVWGNHFVASGTVERRLLQAMDAAAQLTEQGQAPACAAHRCAAALPPPSQTPAPGVAPPAPLPGGRSGSGCGGEGGAEQGGGHAEGGGRAPPADAAESGSSGGGGGGAVGGSDPAAAAAADAAAGAAEPAAAAPSQPASPPEPDGGAAGSPRLQAPTPAMWRAASNPFWQSAVAVSATPATPARPGLAPDGARCTLPASPLDAPRGGAAADAAAAPPPTPTLRPRWLQPAAVAGGREAAAAAPAPPPPVCPALAEEPRPPAGSEAPAAGGARPRRRCCPQAPGSHFVVCDTLVAPPDLDHASDSQRALRKRVRKLARQVYGQRHGEHWEGGGSWWGALAGSDIDTSDEEGDGGEEWPGGEDADDWPPEDDDWVPPDALAAELAWDEEVDDDVDMHDGEHGDAGYGDGLMEAMLADLAAGDEDAEPGWPHPGEGGDAGVEWPWGDDGDGAGSDDDAEWRGDEEVEAGQAEEEEEGSSGGEEEEEEGSSSGSSDGGDDEGAGWAAPAWGVAGDEAPLDDAFQEEGGAASGGGEGGGGGDGGEEEGEDDEDYDPGADADMDADVMGEGEGDDDYGSGEDDL